jgi:hypothetical protein
MSDPAPGPQLPFDHVASMYPFAALPTVDRVAKSGAIFTR